jgi:UPF0755 protein
MRKLFLLSLFVFLISFSVGGIFWWSDNSKPVSVEGENQKFVVTRGVSASQVGQKLYKEGLIKSSLAFKIYVQVKGITKNIQPGIFNLSSNQSLIQIVERLTKNPDELRITIPEGLRREEIVEILITSLEIGDDSVSDFRSQFLAESQGKEGYLFPDTYDFLPGTDAARIVSRFMQTFDQKVGQIGNKYPAGYDLNDIVVLASLIEREAITDEERPVVAGILYNRLENDWPLQVDAAVQYAVSSAKCKGQNAKCDNWWPILTKQDLEIDSPYNTYKYPGIPPAPIANPGLESLKAAANPVTSDYYFYIHSGGKIYYAKTLEEHNTNVRRYLGK